MADNNRLRFTIKVRGVKEGSKSGRSRELLADTENVTGGEYCPDAITEYINESGYRCGASTAVTSNVRKHLLYLGWKVNYKRDSQGVQRVSYTSPDGTIRYDSLRLLCRDLTDEYAFGDDDDEEEKGEQRDKWAGGDIGQPQVPKKGRRERHEPSLDDVVFFEKEYLPEAVVEYCSIGVERKDNVKGNSLLLKDLILNAKKHLSAVGWTFFYYAKGTKRELRYCSPSGRTYSSLITACKQHLKEAEFSCPDQELMPMKPKERCMNSRCGSQPGFVGVESLVLPDIPSAWTTSLRQIHPDLFDDMDGNSATSEVFQEDLIEESGIVEQKYEDFAGGSDMNENTMEEDEITRESSDDESFICYKRRKMSDACFRWGRLI